MNNKYLQYVLFAVLWLIIFSVLQDSIYPWGDDISHLFRDRIIPIPVYNTWISNRVIDGFFTPYCFELFDYLYSALWKSGGTKNFFDMYQSFNSMVYATVFTLLTIILYESSKSDKLKKINQIQISLLIGFCLILFYIPYTNMTTLFAYQITSLLTLSFLLFTFPLSSLYRLGSDYDNSENLSGMKYILLSINAYVVAVGLELFVVFSWIYIFSYIVTLYVSRAIVQPTSQFMVMLSPDRYTLILQFLFYSSWSMYALSTSGRTTHGVNNELATSNSPQFDYFNIIGSSYTLKTIIGFIIICIVLTIMNYLKRNHLPELNERRVSIMLKTLYPIALFSALLSGGYLIALFLLSEVTTQIYVTVKAFIFPLAFVLLIQLLYLFFRGISEYYVKIINGILAITLLIIAVYSLGEMMNEADKRLPKTTKMRYAYDQAAKASGNEVAINFTLPTRWKHNEGYPLLPGENAADWFRGSYRKMLNKYYNTNFGRSGPVFVTKEVAQ